jgi:hypothetical protein
VPLKKNNSCTEGGYDTPVFTIVLVVKNSTGCGLVVANFVQQVFRKDCGKQEQGPVQLIHCYNGVSIPQGTKKLKFQVN